MTTFKDLVKKNRSYRRFDQSKVLSSETLTELVDCVRLVPSGGNTQSMRYRTVSDPKECQQVFETLAWAAQYKDWSGPKEGERPTGYIFLLREKSLSKMLHHDDGIAAATLTLYATSLGLGCCTMQNCQYNHAFKALGIDKEKYAFSCVIALGYPIEQVQLEEVKNDDTHYWREDQVQHVPKRKLSEVLINKK